MLQDYQTVKHAAEEEAIQTLGISAEKLADFQKRCAHNDRPWTEVNNVPVERRQYDDDQDWVCMTCGAQIPVF